MVFQFEHVTRFWDPQHGKWKPQEIALPALKAVFARWQQALQERGWNSLFWSNHDLPRAVSRYTDPGSDRVAAARMLATVLHLMKGTPYIYQGEEIGMTNAGFTTINQYRDVETLNLHRTQTAAGLAEEVFLAGARANSRDNARTPMQWDDGPNAGFTMGVPWLPVNANYTSINAATDRSDPTGVFACYQRLIALRRELPIVRHGSFRLIAPEHAAVFAYLRCLGKQRMLVMANFTAWPTSLELDEDTALAGTDLFRGGTRRIAGTIALKAYETIVVMGPLEGEDGAGTD